MKDEARVIAPIEEPARQYFYIEQLRQMIDEPRTYSMTTMGCQMNARDSEKLAGILEAIGYQKAASEAEADLVIYNTCCVRENAELKVYGKLGYLKGYKKKRSGMKIALCGCMMQEDAVLTKIRQSYPQVDLIFGTHNIYKFAELLYTLETGGGRVIDIWKEHGEIVEDLPSIRKFDFKASVNIMFGCNNFCTYCIVPYVRGRERSRTPEDILREVRALADSGTKEIQLLGQNVNSYGRGLEHPVSFAELLHAVCAVDGIERVTFMTSHPKDLSPELIEAMAEEPKLMHHFHLPLQSGSSRILKMMNRHYDKEQYIACAMKLREAVPDLAITTDLIVGFPQETEEDFQQTLEVARRVRFDNAFTFIYSPRIGTPAAVMEQVPEDVTHERFDRLLKVMDAVIEENNQKRIGSVTRVRAEDVNRKDQTMLTGHSDQGQLVHFRGGRRLIGQLVPVVLDQSSIYYFTGHLAEVDG